MLTGEWLSTFWKSVVPSKRRSLPVDTA